MSRTVQALAVSALVSLLALFALAGSSRLSGPVIWSVSADHGVHVDDLLVLAAWAVCVAWCWRQGGRRDR